MAEALANHTIDTSRYTYTTASEVMRSAIRPKSPDEVMQAWDKALEEAGVNPFPMNRISTALVLHVESGQQGLSTKFLGDSVGSAKSMAEKIIHKLESPLAPAANPNFAGQELIFYRKFLEFLG